MTQFLIDAQLPPALARWLTAQGHPAEHVFDFGGDGTTDKEVLAWARKTHAVIVSKDEDFPMHSMQDATCPQIVWIRIGNTRRTELLQWFSEFLPTILAAVERGERIIEIS